MVFESVFLMTLLDFMAISIVLFAGLVFYRYRVRQGSRGQVLVIMGISLTGVFYAFDIFVMHGLPLFIEPADAMAIMRTLHLDFSWFVIIGGLALIVIGFALNLKAQELATETLANNEERLSFAIAGTNDGLWDWNIVSGEDSFSLRWKEILGYEADEIEPHVDTFTELIHPDDRDRVWHAVESHLDEHTPYNLEIRMRRKSGDYIWVQTKGQASWDENGKPIRMAGAISDINDRKRAEEALRENDRKYQEMFNHAQVGLARTRISDGKVLEANDRLAEIYGYKSREELLAEVKPDEHWTDPAARERIIAEDLKAGGIHDREVQHTRKDGTIIWVRLFTTYYPDLDYLETSNIDITAQKRAEQALAASQERFRSVIDHAPTAIVLKNLDGQIELVNRTYETFFDTSAKDVLGKTAMELYLPDVAARVDDNDQKVAETGIVIVEEAAATQPDLPVQLVRIMKFPVFDQFGAVSGIGTFATDITDEKTTEERLRQAQKMEAVGQLTGGIAHEFNNLLQVVFGNLELLKDCLPDDEEMGRYLQAINRNVIRGSELTDRLLSFSRQQPLAPKAVDITAALAEMRDMLGRTLGEAVDLRSEPADDIWAANADPGQLQNALLNLTLNARDAITGNGIIKLSAKNTSLDAEAVATHEEALPGDYVMLSVTDNGCGMLEEEIEHAFEPFFTTKDIGKGTGLGLSMVYGFAQQSGGFVELESEIEVGTIARLYLPRRAEIEIDEAPHQIRPPEAALSGSGIILLVEDDADVRESLADQLTNLGYQVIEAKDGASALAAVVDGQPIDLLFTDVVMPGGLSGLELAHQLLPLRPGLKVLYTTGYSEDIVSESGPLKEDAIVLRKPYNRAKLAETISSILN